MGGTVKYFYLEPEVSGGLGDDAIMDTGVHPPVVTRLHYEFDGWLGDVAFRATSSRKTRK